MKNRKLNTFFTYLFVILLLVSGLGIICYPIISEKVNEKNKSTVQTEYFDEVQNSSEEEINADLEAAKKYNESLSDGIIEDPFSIKFSETEKYQEYLNTLNLTEEGIMGYLEIPKINVDLPIYHGTSDAVLNKGIGHVMQTAFPVGGKGTHSVLSGHTGLSSSKLFTDLNQLEKGDYFFVDVYNETFVYQVDQILTVLPEKATDYMEAVPDKDYITLITCTPYGVNSHRLLVRGVRSEFPEEEVIKLKEQQGEEDAGSTWMGNYVKYLKQFGFYLAVILIFIFLFSSLRGNGGSD